MSLCEAVHCIGAFDIRKPLNFHENCFWLCLVCYTDYVSTHWYWGSSSMHQRPAVSHVGWLQVPSPCHGNTWLVYLLRLQHPLGNELYSKEDRLTLRESVNCATHSHICDFAQLYFSQNSPFVVDFTLKCIAGRIYGMKKRKRNAWCLLLHFKGTSCAGDIRGRIDLHLIISKGKRRIMNSNVFRNDKRCTYKGTLSHRMGNALSWVQ